MAEPTQYSADGASGSLGEQRGAGMMAARRSHVPPALYTTEEAAIILRVKRSWLERQAARRKIPFTMLGGGYRFTAGHLAEIVLINEESPAPRNNATARGRTTRGRKHVPGLEATSLRPRPRGGPRRPPD
jgi:excisionase family DNA binding protein